MSEMMTNRGIIRELYPETEAVLDKVKRLSADTGLSLEQLGFEEEDTWLDHDNYAIMAGRLFDVSGAPDTYDDDGGYADIRQVSAGIYEINLRYYNGGTCMEELIGEYLGQEDAKGIQPHD